MNKAVCNSLLTLLLGLMLPTAVAAHPGHPVGWQDVVQAGPYKVTLEQSPSPLKAHANIDLVVAIEGSDVQTRAYIRTMPPKGSTTVPKTHNLTSHPSLPGMLSAYMYTLPEAGEWRLEVMVDGPRGRGTGQTRSFAVEGPPGLPLWLGWALGFVPGIGLVWFLLRERRRVAAAIAADGGARV